MYEWHATSLPVADFDGQVYVDSKNLVWRWDATASAWLRAEQMYLKEVARFWIMATHWAVGTSGLTQMFNGRPRNQWDDFYTKTLCKLVTAQSNQTFYRAHMTMSELQDWVLTPLNTSGGEYDENAEVIVYEVVDPTIRCSRIQVWNSVYSSARGRLAYNRRIGRNKAGLPEKYQCDSNWRAGSYWTDGFTEPGRDFLSAFHGIAAPSSPVQSDGLIWFHGSHRNLYHHPRVGSSMPITANEKPVWDNATLTYKMSFGSFTIGSPRVFYRTGATGTDRQLDTPDGCVAGNEFFAGQVAGIMVYPVVSSDGLHAFYVKPLGVDWVALSFDSDVKHQIVAVTSYGDTVQDLRRAPAGEWNPSGKLSFRFGLFDAVPTTEGQRHSSIDDASTPKRIRFLARDTITGVVSETFATEIEVVTRKANITKCFEPRYAG